MITQSNPLKLPIFQSAWVVDDIETACLEWSKNLGIGPFFVNQYGPDEITNTTYRGQPGRFEIIVALAQAGQTQIELIQPLVEPSIYRDAIKPGQPGFHHVGAWSHDIESDIVWFEELNFPAITTGLSLACNVPSMTRSLLMYVKSLILVSFNFFQLDRRMLLHRRFHLFFSFFFHPSYALLCN